MLPQDSLLLKSKSLFTPRKIPKPPAPNPPTLLSTLPNEPFLRILKYLPFALVYTKCASLNRGVRQLIFHSYEVLHKERCVMLDLSVTTKVLKKLPKYVATRLNYLCLKVRQDSPTARIQRALKFLRAHSSMRVMVELFGVDDSDRGMRERLKLFREVSVRRLVIKKCNLQEKKTHVLDECVQLYVKDSFLKVWVKDKLKVREIHVSKSTIVYGKSSLSVFPEARKFICTGSLIKNPEFTWRPLTESIEELVLVNNDYYGVLSFNIVYHVVFYGKKFRNLKHLEFEGQVDEDTFIKLLINITHYKQLTMMRFINKGAFFNFKMVQNNGDVMALKVFEGASEVIRVNEDTSRIIRKFQVPGEDTLRTIDFTFLNY